MSKVKVVYVPLRTLTEQDYIDRLEKIVWKGKFPTSPYVPNAKVWKLKDGWYMCSKTRKKFNARTGTIFRHSNLPLWKWFWAFQMYSSKQGITAHQLMRSMGVDIKTAWFILHRLRDVSNIDLFSKFNEMTEDFAKSEEVYELDEVYPGGKNKNRHWDKKVPNSQGRSGKDKIPTFVMVKRGGNAIAKVVPNAKQKTLVPIIRKYIKKGSTVNTDEWPAYKNLGKLYNHRIVNHRKKQYAKGKDHVNTAESFNARLKIRIYGTYIHISRKHAQRYVNEAVFRWNTRKYTDEERFDLLLASVVGKRLTYRELIRG